MTQHLTPDQLQITPAEYDGLVRLRDFFAKTAIPTVVGDDLGHVESHLDDEVTRTTMGFSMEFGAAIVAENEDAYSCGCAACIGGHLSLMMEGADLTGSCFTKEGLLKANNYVNRKDGHPTLEKLFYPRQIISDDWSRITPRLAADAIENFLVHGEPLWKSIARREGLRIKGESE
jgi:hypothetical protein